MGSGFESFVHRDTGSTDQQLCIHQHFCNMLVGTSDGMCTVVKPGIFDHMHDLTWRKMDKIYSINHARFHS